MIRYQRDELREQFLQVREERPDLAILVYAAGGYLDDEYGLDLWITSILREDGVHSTLRAVVGDIILEDEDFSGTDDEETYPILVEVQEWLNEVTRYGKGYDGVEKETVKDPDHGRGLHLHIQVPGPRPIELILP